MLDKFRVALRPATFAEWNHPCATHEGREGLLKALLQFIKESDPVLRMLKITCPLPQPHLLPQGIWPTIGKMFDSYITRNMIHGVGVVQRENRDKRWNIIFLQTLWMHVPYKRRKHPKGVSLGDLLRPFLLVVCNTKCLKVTHRIRDSLAAKSILLSVKKI